MSVIDRIICLASEYSLDSRSSEDDDMSVLLRALVLEEVTRFLFGASLTVSYSSYLKQGWWKLPLGSFVPVFATLALVLDVLELFESVANDPSLLYHQ